MASSSVGAESQVGKSTSPWPPNSHHLRLWRPTFIDPRTLGGRSEAPHGDAHRHPCDRSCTSCSLQHALHHSERHQRHVCSSNAAVHTLLPTRCLSGVLQSSCGTSFQVASACLQSWGCGSKRPFSCTSFCRVLRFDRRELQLPPSRELSVCCSSALGSCLRTPTTASSS